MKKAIRMALIRSYGLEAATGSAVAAHPGTTTQGATWGCADLTAQGTGESAELDAWSQYSRTQRLP